MIDHIHTILHSPPRHCKECSGDNPLSHPAWVIRGGQDNLENLKSGALVAECPADIVPGAAQCTIEHSSFHSE